MLARNFDLNAITNKTTSKEARQNRPVLLGSRQNDTEMEQNLFVFFQLSSEETIHSISVLNSISSVMCLVLSSNKKYV